MDAWCRVCSRNDDFRRFPVFAVAEVSQEVIANMITSCTDTQVSSEDGLPQQICPDCLIALSLSYSFRKLCRRSDAKFRETYDGRTLLQPVDSQQRRSQSQVNDDNSFDTIPAIKEEVEFYEYECNLPPQEDQWVIQNPRTIGEGAMTVVHSSSQYYDEPDDNGDQDASVVVPMATQDPSEFGECSGMGRKEEKWKKKPPTPERFSKRIRRQESPAPNEPVAAEKLPAELNPNWNSATTHTEETNTSSGTKSKPIQQRCEYCKKKMKKSYKHRNGKCLAPKGKNASRPRCVYCQMSFVRSTNISIHLRNSCRVYRQLCNKKGIEPPDASHQAVSTILPSNDALRDSVNSPIQTDNQPEPVDRKPILRKTQPKKLTRTKCQYCKMLFTKRGNLINHQRERCKILKERNKIKHLEPSSTTVESAWEDIVPKRQLRQSRDARTSIDKSQTEKQQPTIEAETKCVYCTQKVSKKTRFQHHNGRCVLGRVNAEHPCAYCPMAFSSRSNLLRHQRERCQPYREEQDITTESGDLNNSIGTSDKVSHDESAKEPSSVSETKREPIEDDPPAKKSKVRRAFHRHRRQRIKDSVERPKHKEKRRIRHSLVDNNQTLEYSCGYCRKSFAIRDELLEHQRNCNVRKMHKQVKCQYCGTIISNRGNLRKHQRLYCKRIPRSDEIKKELEEEESSKKQKIAKKISKQEKPDDGDVNLKKQVEKVASKPCEDPAAENTVKKLTKLCHPCEYCKRLFKSAAQARRHARKCTVKRSLNEFHCNLCSEGFANRSNLYRHQRVRCKRLGRNKVIANSKLEKCLKLELSPILSSKSEQHTGKPDPDDQSTLCNSPLLKPDLHTVTRPILELEADSRTEKSEYIVLEEKRNQLTQNPPKEELLKNNLLHNNNAEGVGEAETQVESERVSLAKESEENEPLRDGEKLAEEVLSEGEQGREQVLYGPVSTAETDKI